MDWRESLFFLFPPLISRLCQYSNNNVAKTEVYNAFVNTLLVSHRGEGVVNYNSQMREWRPGPVGGHRQNNNERSVGKAGMKSLGWEMEEVMETAGGPELLSQG